MNYLAHIADRVLNRPLLITPDKAQVILSVLGNRIGVDGPSADRFEGEPFERDQSGEISSALPYRVKDGVAIISIVGSLVNRGAYIGASSGLVSYEGFKRQVKHARANDRVLSVILDMQSPGGEAIGAFEAAEQVRLLAAEKPTIAIVNGMAASAAYAIASAATEVVTTETGVSGSIGVVLLHADYSGFLADKGIQPTLIFAGGHKVDGNPFEPLPEEVRADLQAEVDAFYNQFLRTVAKGRGDRLTADMARETEARTFIGEAAVDRGLADRVGTFETVLSDLSRATAKSAKRTSLNGGLSMSEHNGAPTAENAGISQAEHNAAVSQARTEGEQAGATAERDRLAAILGADGIKGEPSRVAAAMDLATKSPTMSAEDVVAYVTDHTAKTEVSPAPSVLDASLAARAADADPIGANAGNDSGKAASGLSRQVTAAINSMARR